jgi:hypothetical protein
MLEVTRYRYETVMQPQAAGSVFTTLQFLPNLRMSPISIVFVPDDLIQANVIKHFSLQGKFVSCEEYKVL